ncbi:ARP2/3 complex 16 kDa subunit (p16-Arc)-domain-containing protein [Trametes elegans]|nr:ARP2/3 complex 16 kDa subunit (p16-Arc)-domain-containing protein [Trametes elegans]
MDVSFRKIDIDQYDEDALLDTELYDADPRDPSQALNDVKQKAAAVRGSLAKGDVVGALTLVLEDAPYGPNVEEAKNQNLQTLVSILNSTKAAEITGVVKALSTDAQDTLMKYLYKGMALPGWGEVSGSVLLGWHEKLTEVAGTESLTHVTAFLDPPDLFTLARTCKLLHAHVADDNTWRRAYVQQYLGITPEGDLRDDAGERTLMLRREESSWKKEFVLRYNLRRRWEYSRNSSITHIPHHSAITAMHLMPNNTLLAASLQYGIVSRSYPLSGKVLRGFLDASGTGNGLGIGNPNAEFSPHVSSIALASDGGTAKILWGYRNGEVAVTTAVRVMDNNRASAAKLVKCRLGDCHEGSVECLAWEHGSPLFVTGGADGRVKLWDIKTSLRCLWTSGKGPDLVPDPCVRLAVNLQQGTIAVALKSGAILLWTGFSSLPPDPSDGAVPEPRELRVPALSLPIAAELSTFVDAPSEISHLHIVPQQDCASLLVAHHLGPQFQRLTWTAAGDLQRTLFGDPAGALIRTLFPVWASRLDEGAFVIAGDELGAISIFPWDANIPLPLSSSTTPVLPIHQFTAHEDGAVTALAWNPAILVSGSSRGTVRVWDSLTFAPLRVFSSPAARPATGAEWDGVSQIVLDRDTMMVSVGSRVMAWKAGPVGRHGKGKTVRSARSNGTAKWHQQLEMHRDIAESRRELEEEQVHTRRTFGREREQLSTLAHLGLSEVEAVEYVLMLSREEEEARSQPGVSSAAFGVDEGVFIADFDDIPTPMPTSSNIFESQSSSALSSRTSSLSGHSPPSAAVGTSVFQGGRTLPRAMSSTSNHKVQVSPRFRPEPMEAGSSTSPLPSHSASSSGGVPPPVSDADHFPAVSRTPSSASGSAGPNAGISFPSTPASSVGDSVPGSPHSVRSAWSTPLRSLHPSEAPSPPWIGASPSQSPVHSLTGALAGTSLSRRGEGVLAHVDEDDEDLRFAIELSLAEARSRGEDV